MGVEEGTSNGDSIKCAQGFQCLESGAVTNGFKIGTRNEVAGKSMVPSEHFRTYTRRRRGKSQLDNIGGRSGAGPAAHLAEQPLKDLPHVDVNKISCEQGHLPLKGRDDCFKKPYKNVVLEHIYRSLNDKGGGIKGCIHNVLECYPDMDCLMSLKEQNYHFEHKHYCSFQAGRLSNEPLKEFRRHVSLTSNGCIDISHDCTISEMCQNAFFHVIASKGFMSLCKLLSENFQGIINGDLLDFSVIDFKMKDGMYERSPMLFLQDFQQVWTKLQGIGNEIVSFAESLNEFSRVSFNQQARGLIQSSSENGKVETEDCVANKLCICRHCGGKADGKECLICDSCEEMYHVSCIKPAVNEIPSKSWYCSVCAAHEIAFPHENCAVCKRLKGPKSMPGEAGNDSATDEETVSDLGEHSNCSVDDVSQQSEGGKYVCKICEGGIDGEDVMICSHHSCVGKFYHVRCLAQKQLKLYGPHWYCPSCLCRVCLVDRDDDKIILCDGCDHGYHLYCLKPPLTSIPSGKWFCRKCKEDILAIKGAKRAYYETRRKRKCQEELQASDKGRRAINMLITAANTLDFEDDLFRCHRDQY